MAKANDNLKEEKKPVLPESSQTEVQDFDEPKLSETNPALYMDKYNKNEIKLAGKVIELEVSNPKPKIDKQTNQPVTGQDGQPEYWDPFYSAEIIFEGGSMRMNVSSEMHSKLTVGKRYQFDGMFGLGFGKIQPKFFSATLIA